MMFKFKAEIAIIGINPYVLLPEDVLTGIFEQAGKNKGTIPVCGMINEIPYKQTLLKYSGLWRLYINTHMLKNSPKRIGEVIRISIELDQSDRTIKPHPKLIEALNQNQEAKVVYERLSPSLKKEIVRYIDNLKTVQSIDSNIARAIDFLLGKGRFVGRNHP
ncbi:YdeI/OmpD-associated family protein [Pedobacter sp. ASV1-7]|uniref:YdeI/OmpD-associated family protein n=1 Tax=Pedobacter sp. ASV1-7 TaxID=3145237 RepID=UPI0032E912E4